MFIFTKKDGEYKENISDLSGISKNILFSFLIAYNFILVGRGPTSWKIFAKFYIFVSVLEQKMYTLAIVGLLTTVMSHLLLKNY